MKRFTKRTMAKPQQSVRMSGTRAKRVSRLEGKERKEGGTVQDSR